MQSAAISDPESERARLTAGLGPLDGAALVISNVVGTGIFVTPGLVYAYVPQPLPFLAVWLAGGLLSVAGALSYAELAAMNPRSGGEYVYIREAFGPLAGFLSGWTSFVAGFSGAIAAGAVGFAAYLGRLWPPAARTGSLFELSLGPLQLELSPRSLVALAVIFGFTAVHLRGLAPGRIVQNVLALLSVSTLVGLVAVGVGFLPGVAPSGAPLPGSASMSGGLQALVLVMFTYSGWNAAAYVTEEIRDPGRNIARALVPATAAVTVLYLVVNALYLRVLPPAELAGDVSVGYSAARALFGGAAARVATPIVLLALASSISAMIVTGPRVYFAMARDGTFPRPFGRVAAATRVPSFAILAQAIWSATLVVSGTFGQLLTYTGFAVVLFAGIAVVALFRLRWRQPDAVRPFRVPGFPFLPATFIIASLAMVLYAIGHAPGPSLAGLLCITAGIPLYFWCSRRAVPGGRDPAL